MERNPVNEAAAGTVANGPAGRLRALWEEHPLAVVMGLAAVLRLAAALLSAGYRAYDDHYNVVEVAQSWADGHWDLTQEGVVLRSLVYPWLHFALFKGLQDLGVDDPQAKMLVVRLLHGAWSLLTVWFGYRAAAALAGERRARLAGLLLAVFWIQPFMSVRNMIEAVCQPFLVGAAWLLVRGGAEAREQRGWNAFVAGLLLGLAFVVRFQTLVIAGATGLVLLAQRRWRDGFLLGGGTAIAASVVQGGSDWIGFGKPFASVLAYYAYNANPHNLAGYPKSPWFMYLLLLAGVLIPPTSLMLLQGVARTWRSAAVLFWPALAFFAFHSAYPGKQERFLLPIVPAVLVLAALGWHELAERSAFWARRPRLAGGLWAWFWVVNGLLLAVMTTTYGKRSAIESLSWLHGRADLRGVVWETSEVNPVPLPIFYLRRDVPVYDLTASRTVESLRAEIASRRAPPNYVVMLGTDRLEERLRRLGPLLPGLALQRTITPSLHDWVLHRLNPSNNVNLTAYVYRVGSQ
jgi:4-amino-4-deoxy-L-arabinose transferase-like glycosyltransferase